jgi:hypothetical protein
MFTVLFVVARIVANPVSNVFQKQLAQRAANPISCNTMPAVFDNTLQRRRFLQLGSLGAVSFFAGRLQAADDSPPAEKFRVALLSDTHIPGDRINGHRGFVHPTFGEATGDPTGLLRLTRGEADVVIEPCLPNSPSRWSGDSCCHF